MKEILNFINSNNNWEELLTESPYYIKIKHDGDYILLQYTQFASDFSIQLVRECRGSIFKRNKFGRYECVCAPFTKFFNINEPYAADIDWYSASVFEKVDGSLIKVWYDDNAWHISTNGTIDAFKAMTVSNKYSYGDLFLQAIKMPIDEFMQGKSTNVTYLFELVSPYAPLTIQYNDTNVYLLTVIGNSTFHEYGNKLEEPFKNCKLPKTYRLSTLDDCLKAVEKMSSQEEGFVVVDDFNNRVKIKSPEFLKAFHFINNNQFVIKNVLDAIFNGYYDDMIAYQHGEIKKFSESVYNAYNRYFNLLFDVKQLALEDAKQLNRREFYNKYVNTKAFDYAMKLKSSIDNKQPIQQPMDYIKNCYNHKYASFEKLIKSLIESEDL